MPLTTNELSASKWTPALPECGASSGLLNSNSDGYLNITPYSRVHLALVEGLSENSLLLAGVSMENNTVSPYLQESFEGLSAPLQIFLSTVIIFILLVSFLGNVVVCLMVYQRAAMRSAINILLASLAFADMMLAVLNMPFALVSVITNQWIFGDVFCKVSAMFFWLLPCAKNPDRLNGRDSEPRSFIPRALY
ncbi:UNVERIFIED_CONTAM: hypothetical protein FKN15_038923 [Acipenser sinensis]